MQFKLIQYCLLLVFVPAAFSDSSFGQQTTEYYRHLVFRETPFSQHRGIYPINETEKDKTAHYRFEYDENGQVLEISHRIGNQLIADNGNWDSFTWWAPKIRYHYSESQTTVLFYDHFDEPTEAIDGAAKAVFTHDEHGRRTELQFYDLNDEPTENHWNIHRYVWSHPENGVVIEERFNLAGDIAYLRPNLTFEKIKLVYGDDDLLDFMYHIDSEGKLINNTLGAAVDRIVYDRNHNFIRWMVFDADTNLAEGNAPELALGEHLYDEFGNKIGMRGYDVHMHRKAFPFGFAEEFRTYDSFGNLTSEKYLTLSNQLVLHITLEYSVDGTRLIAINNVDENGELQNHLNWGWARQEIIYSDDGRIAARNHFSKDGALLEL